MIVPIHVTMDDISRGRPSDMTACPVALAMVRVLGHRVNRVGLGFAELDGYDVVLPSNVRVFMIAFDAGWPVLPFEFTVDIPGPEPEEDEP